TERHVQPDARGTDGDAGSVAGDQQVARRETERVVGAQHRAARGEPAEGGVCGEREPRTTDAAELDHRVRGVAAGDRGARGGGGGRLDAAGQAAAVPGAHHHGGAVAAGDDQRAAGDGQGRGGAGGSAPRAGERERPVRRAGRDDAAAGGQGGGGTDARGRGG